MAAAQATSPSSATARLDSTLGSIDSLNAFADLSAYALPAVAHPSSLLVTDAVKPITFDHQPNAVQEYEFASCCDHSWQGMPDGLIYRSYLAGTRESRIGNQWINEKSDRSLWDATLGGRIGLLRYGTTNNLQPEGWQLDIEGAAFPRLDPNNDMDLTSVDFRFGVPLTYGQGPWQVKMAYYHLSSHLGDEYVFRNNITTRYNYSRDAIVLGGSYYIGSDVRVYGEVDWAFHSDVSEPWAFQFGVEYSSRYPTGWRGSPFLAINVHLRQEIDFSGNMVLQTGWQWRGQSGHLLRAGLHYHNGLSNQYSFFNQFEEQLGGGLWYDF